METGENRIQIGNIEIAFTSMGKGKPVIVLGGPWFGQRYIRPVAELLSDKSTPYRIVHNSNPQF